MARRLEIELGYFERASCAAFVIFAADRVGRAVVQVGIGGRRDATNVLASEVTMVGLDHADRLGTTVSQIAKEKAGIVKTGSVLVTGRLGDPVRQIFLDRHPVRAHGSGAQFASMSTGGCRAGVGWC